MGADLYIQSIYIENKKRYEAKFNAACAKRDAAGKGTQGPLQAEVDKYYELMYSKGYFRDSYNNSSILWQLGLSWWVDVIPLQNKNGELSIPKMKKFKKMLEAHPFPEDFKVWAKTETGKKVRQEIKQGHMDDSMKEWHKFYVKQYQALLVFLDMAIALKEPIYCSL